jgi:hypothetical protein
MITIRDRNFRIIARGDNLRVVTAHRAPVERVDLWTRSRQIGVTWVDGASTIFDVSSPEAVRRWAHEWAGSLLEKPVIKEH